MVRVLRRFGIEVDFPADQTCCGQPVFNSGFSNECRKLAKRVLNSFRHSQYVVVPSGSCATMIREFYPQLFQEEDELAHQAKELSSKTYEFSQFLVNVLGVNDPGARFDGKVTYHPSCHLLREMGISEEPKTLLRSVQGVDYMELPEAEICCGFGGTFSVKYPHISEAMLEEKLNNIVATGAQAVVACDMSCLMHIGGGLSRRGIDVKPMHLAQLVEGES